MARGDMLPKVSHCSGDDRIFNAVLTQAVNQVTQLRLLGEAGQAVPKPLMDQVLLFV
jgi:hypothetical protein